MQTNRWAPVGGIIGVGLHLFSEVADADWTMTGRSVPVISAAIVLTLLTLGLAALFREGRLRSLRHALPALAPIGMLLGANTVLAVGGHALPLLDAGPDVGCGILGMQLSLTLLVSLVLSAIAVIWTSRAILRLAAGDDADTALTLGLTDVRDRFWRGLSALAIGHGVNLLLLAGLALVAAGAPRAMMVAMVFGAFLTIAWNLASATLLLAVLHSDEPFGRALASAITAARRHFRAFALPVLAQLVLLGAVVMVGTSYSVQFFWVGGYEYDSNWLDAVIELHRDRRSPLFATLLLCASLWLAVAIKLRIAHALTRAKDGGTEPASTPPPA